MARLDTHDGELAVVVQSDGVVRDDHAPLKVPGDGGLGRAGELGGNETGDYVPR